MNKVIKFLKRHRSIAWILSFLSVDIPVGCIGYFWDISLVTGPLRWSLVSIIAVALSWIVATLFVDRLEGMKE